MMKNLYHHLFNAVKDHVATVRNIQTIGSVYISELSSVNHRAAQLTLLELLLDEYRQNHKSSFNKLSGKQALHHLLLTKYKWPLHCIRELTLSDILLILHDDLKIDNFDSETATYLTRVLVNYQTHHFSDVMDEEWDPEILERVLQQPRW